MTEPKEGDQVYALGSMRGQPYATGIAAKLTSVTSGSLGIDTEIPDAYLGGPLLDADGRVVGVLTKSGAGGSTATPAEGATGATATLNQAVLAGAPLPLEQQDEGDPEPVAGHDPGQPGACSSCRSSDRGASRNRGHRPAGFQPEYGGRADRLTTPVTGESSDRGIGLGFTGAGVGDGWLPNRSERRLPPVESGGGGWRRVGGSRNLRVGRERHIRRLDGE